MNKRPFSLGCLSVTHSCIVDSLDAIHWTVLFVVKAIRMNLKPCSISQDNFEYSTGVQTKRKS